MDLFEAIQRRACYRGSFTEAPVPRADLERIVGCGLAAPSAKNEQTPRFVIVDDPALLAELAEIIQRPVCRTCKAMIVCMSDPRPVYEGIAFPAEDCAAAVQNMLLAITALGYATVWLDGVLRLEDRRARIATLLGVPERLCVHVILPVGVPAEPVRGPEKLPFDRRAWFNRYRGS